MRKPVHSIIILLLACFAHANAFAQEEFKMESGDTSYVMRQYFMCLLKKGPVRDQDSTAAAKIQEGHLAHIKSMADQGKISIAGPFGDDGEIRGILVYHTATLAEAEALQSQDPAVKAGRLIMEFHPWWAARGSKLY